MTQIYIKKRTFSFELGGELAANYRLKKDWRGTWSLFKGKEAIFVMDEDAGIAFKGNKGELKAQYNQHNTHVTQATVEGISELAFSLYNKAVGLKKFNFSVKMVEPYRKFDSHWTIERDDNIIAEYHWSGASRHPHKVVLTEPLAKDPDVAYSLLILMYELGRRVPMV